jgi:hypothetical protein
MQAQWQREHPSFLPIETDPLPADLLPTETDLLPACLRTAPRVELERPPSFAWVAVGVALFFGAVIGGGYWLIQRWQPPVETAGVSPSAAPAKPAPAAALPRAASPQLSVGLPALLRQTTTGSVAAQSAVPAPSPPPQLVVGLRPTTGQPPSDAPAPQPAAQAPPPAEPLPSPTSPPKPHRKAVAHQSSPVANPNQSSGFVKF